MKSKRKNPEQCYNSTIETPLTPSFNLCLTGFGLSLLACYFSTFSVSAGFSSEKPSPTNLPAPTLTRILQEPNSLNVSTQNAKPPPTVQEQSETTNADFVSSSTKVHKESIQGGSVAIQNRKDPVRGKLWQARISIPKSEKAEQNKNELQRIIEQIRAVRFDEPKKTREAVIVVEPGRTIEPNNTLSAAKAISEPQKKTVEFRLPYEPVSKQTLQVLESLSQHPEQPKNPFALAEVLFLSGNIKEAAIFYQEALDRKGVDTVQSPQDKAWILFQIANCLRNHDPLTAKNMYKELIAQYPDSPWADLAKVRDALIDWEQKDKPRTLLEDRTWPDSQAAFGKAGPQ
ncbi:MAG TPA: hypothetical protein VMW16_00585 [Sedimentisphaerales bacterium]|nr:hypothetical protein [Sedimentisphaerales bacterium]